MLSRSAQGLYWIGRYLERAQHGCRLLADQMEALEDRTVEEIDRCWRRLYSGLGQTPVGGGLSSSEGDENFMRADAYTLADDLTFEAKNPDSIHNCLALARENARKVRHVLGGDMWFGLNVAYLGLRDTAIADIWADGPGAFYRRTEDAIQAFLGIAESAMYRDEGWHFLRLGRFVERAQLLAALLEAQLAVCPADDPHAEADWRALLRICEARLAHNRLHGFDYRPDKVIDLLVSDPLLSHSIRHALAQIREALEAISTRGRLAVALERRTGRMVAHIDYGWPERDAGAARGALREVRDSCRRLHEDIDATYFHYEIEDAPGS